MDEGLDGTNGRKPAHQKLLLLCTAALYVPRIRANKKGAFHEERVEGSLGRAPLGADKDLALGANVRNCKKLIAQCSNRTLSEQRVRVQESGVRIAQSTFTDLCFGQRKGSLVRRTDQVEQRLHSRDVPRARNGYHEICLELHCRCYFPRQVCVLYLFCCGGEAAMRQELITLSQEPLANDVRGARNKLSKSHGPALPHWTPPAYADLDRPARARLLGVV